MAVDIEHGVREKSVYAILSKHDSTDLYIPNGYNYANSEGRKKYSQKKKKIEGSCGEIRMDFLSLSAIFPFC